MRVALITDQDLPDEARAENAMLRREMVRRGVLVRAVAWDAPAVDFRRAEIGLLRCDPKARSEPFLAFIAEAGRALDLVNGAAAIARGFADDALATLAGRGVPVVHGAVACRDARRLSVFVIDGICSHAVAEAGDGRAAAVVPTTSELLTANQAFHLSGGLDFARIDLVTAPGDEARVAAVDVLAPRLHARVCPLVVRRLADLVCARLRDRAGGQAAIVPVARPPS